VGWNDRLGLTSDEEVDDYVSGVYEKADDLDPLALLSSDCERCGEPMEEGGCPRCGATIDLRKYEAAT
jgi:hypothetical protein